MQQLPDACHAAGLGGCGAACRWERGQQDHAQPLWNADCSQGLGKHHSHVCVRAWTACVVLLVSQAVWCSCVLMCCMGPDRIKMQADKVAANLRPTRQVLHDNKA